ncbi:hypothetical protein PROPHIT493_33 [Mycobacterium phage prophiT49-3]|nr:hypothetical protein PROPHIT493_33 [Mycobacterium phage prophiT49-3]
MNIEEDLAKALWDVVPYDRFYEWEEHPNEEIREHYRDRARRLLRWFRIERKP